MTYFGERLLSAETRLEELEVRKREIDCQEAKAALEFDRHLLEMVSNLMEGEG
jgi:hypothetical protein